MSSRRLPILAAATAVVLISAAAVATTGRSATASVAATGASGHTGYAVIRPLCATPTSPTAITCFALERKTVSRSAPGAEPFATLPAYSEGPAGGFTPNDLADAYGYDPSTGGDGQTVALVDWYDDNYVAGDLATFDRRYRLPHETATSFRKVNQAGKASPLPPASNQTSGEIALDVESVRAVCNNCRILLVEADSPSQKNLGSAENTAARLGATEISNSYGGPESKQKLSNSFVAAFDHPGVVITVSSGDDGWDTWDLANNFSNSKAADTSKASAEFPSTSPDVVAVGGTSLELNSDGTREEEDVWNENGPDDFDGYDYNIYYGAQGASGGGCSKNFAAPSWQAAFAGYSTIGCNGMRNATDVAALADPYTGFDVYDTSSGGWITVGGTSLSSPIVAAMYALAGGAGGAAYPAQSLYANATSDSEVAYDITAGGNAWCGGDDSRNCSNFLSGEGKANSNPNALANYKGQPGGLKDCSFPADGSPLVGDPFSLGCNAGVGFDGPSGLGAPQGLGLFRPAAPSLTVSRPAGVGLKRPDSFSATATPRDGATSITGYSWAWGDGSKTTTTTGTAQHTYSHAGHFTLTVTATDNLGRSSVASTSFTAGKPIKPRISGPQKARAGMSISFSDYGTRDPDTGARIIAEKWAWDDGSKASTGAKVSHVFRKPGTYDVTLTISDNAGDAGKRTVKIPVK